ncbi:M42 family metallopeptidase [Pasteuria penetrans]|uniref:M42 family metallopeptidase n=1 Tax=Pasteuria penetrans TaxID=86005 RepID=UPI000F97925D|nr:M42 family metallopeptidase [Pasteuria penetrans]
MTGSFSVEKKLRDLVNADGVSGFEDPVRRCMRDHLSPMVEEILYDRLGGMVGRKQGDPEGPRVLIAGHMDEVGFLVTGVTKGGFLRFQTIGSWWSQNVLGHRVRIHSRDGGVHRGVIGCRSPHLLKVGEREKTVQVSDLFIDIGAGDSEEVAQWGIRPGDSIAPDSCFYTLADGMIWAGKALDNRAGCLLAIEVVERLKEQSHPNILFAGATVQEEVGLRGAETLARLVEPDVAFALDVDIATDTPSGCSSGLRMGAGPVLAMYDDGLISHRFLCDFVLDVAREIGIPVQKEAGGKGGTDGGKFHRFGIGCPTVTLGFATRYIHSHNSLLHKDDFMQSIQLLTAVLRRLDRPLLKDLLR